MRKYERCVNGASVFCLGASIDDIAARDIVIPSESCAVGVWYHRPDDLRDHLVLSDDLDIDESSAVVQLSDICNWADFEDVVDPVFFLIVHDFEDNIERRVAGVMKIVILYRKLGICVERA